MHHPKNIQNNEFTYTLPEEKIAQYPLQERDQSKLLVYRHQIISEDIYANISKHLPEGALLVFNNTRVIHARMMFQKPSGGIIEIFALEPADPQGYGSLLLRNKGVTRWKCLVGGAGKWKRGQLMQKQITIEGMPVKLTAAIAGRPEDCFIIEFSWTPVIFNFQQVLEQAGSVPIPPYLKRDAAPHDDDRYQTIYAQKQGSVAAPTAGLHFTENIFNALANKHIEPVYITLHVGAGTFLPVKSTTLEGHTMHAEEVQVDTGLLNKLIHHQAAVFAVGTTSLRTLESLYWMGIKCMADPQIPAEKLGVNQWDPYEPDETAGIDADTALRSLLQWMHSKRLEKLSIKTRLLIAPPYRPKIANGLITNFHQPASTLLLLVAAVTENRWKEIYDYALQHDFRFLSYGDGSLLFFN